jgi:ADP-ribose pyrophosphatase
MPHGPTATTLESRTAFHGRVFSVTSDRVRLQNGRDVTMDVVRHSPSVIVVPMADAEHVVLIRQYRYSVDAWLWETPAGSVDPGEDVEEAARRECHEEIGLTPDRVTPIGQFLPTPGYCDEVMHFFKAEGLHTPDTHAEADPDEMIEVHTVAVTEAKAMVMRGEIPDLKTAMALMMV